MRLIKMLCISFFLVFTLGACASEVDDGISGCKPLPKMRSDAIVLSRNPLTSFVGNARSFAVCYNLKDKQLHTRMQVVQISRTGVSAPKTVSLDMKSCVIDANPVGSLLIGNDQVIPFNFIEGEIEDDQPLADKLGTSLCTIAYLVLKREGVITNEWF